MDKYSWHMPRIKVQMIDGTVWRGQAETCPNYGSHVVLFDATYTGRSVYDKVTIFTKHIQAWWEVTD